MGTFQVGMMLPAGALGEEHRGRTPRVWKLLTAGETGGQWVKPGQVSIRFSMICHDFKGLTCSNYVHLFVGEVKSLGEPEVPMVPRSVKEPEDAEKEKVEAETGGLGGSRGPGLK